MEFKSGVPSAEKIPESRIGDYTKTVELAHAERSIKESYPDLPIESIAPFKKGMANDLFLVNGKDVFRFSKSPEEGHSLAREAAILPALEKELSVPVPHFEWAKRAGDKVEFVGYPMLPGRHPETSDAYDWRKRPNAEMARSIGLFFKELHNFNTEAATSLGLEQRNYKEFYSKYRSDFHNILTPVLQERFPQTAAVMLRRLDEAFDNYFAEQKNFQFNPALLHGDLESVNMLIDPESKTLSGVLDWGAAHVGDPDYDFWRPYFHFGKKFMDEVLKTYSHPDHARLYAKMEFFMTAQICFRLMRAVLKEGAGSERAGRHFKYVENRLMKECPEAKSGKVSG